MARQFNLTSPYFNKFVQQPTPAVRSGQFDPSTIYGTSVPLQAPPQQQYQLPPNLFGVNNPLQPRVPEPTPAQGPAPPPDYASEYGKIVGNRPNRLAYQQAVQQGAPEIQRSKWAQLGAALAAGAAGLANPRDPAGAYTLGRSSYLEPQRRSDEQYERKMKGLERLSQFEESDKAEEIRALEMRQKEWYDRQELQLKKDAEKRAADAEARAAKLTDAQIEHIHFQMDQEGTDEWTNPTTGITYKRNSKGVIREVGQTKLTPEQEAAKAGAEEKAKKAAAEPFEKSADERRAASAMNVARETTSRATTVQGMKSDAAVRAIKARNENIAAKAFKPGDTAKQIYVDLTNEFATNPELVGEDLNDYIDIATGPGGNSIIQAKPPRSIGPITIPDSAQAAGIKQMVREAIAKSIETSKSKVGGKGAAGDEDLDMRKYLPDPNDPNHTIPNPNYRKPKVK